MKTRDSLVIVAFTCGSTGVYAVTVSDCYSVTIGSGDGIDVALANNCFGCASGTSLKLKLMRKEKI